MKLSEIGEFGFIERLSENFAQKKEKGVTGIGDDCAIMPLDNKFEQVVTTDMLIEDIHFLREKVSPFLIGYKSLAVNLSDIAAMGAQPTASFLSIAIPSDVEVEYLDRFMEGYKELSEKYNVPLLGGDTTQSPGKLTINVCVLGKIERGKARRRSSARPGDIICVTGPLGDSGGGLKIILENIDKTDDAYHRLTQWHNQPEPAVKEGLWLASYPGVRAMMDISDGIASDLKHILKASRCEATIQLEKIPLSDDLIKVSDKEGWNAINLAVTAGEDYRLLLTVEKSCFKELSNRFNKEFPFPLSPIGIIVDENTPGKIEWTENGKTVNFSGQGFNHFNT